MLSIVSDILQRSQTGVYAAFTERFGCAPPSILYSPLTTGPEQNAVSSTSRHPPQRQSQSRDQASCAALEPRRASVGL